MAGIRLEFAQFGHFDSFDVIRSLSTMAHTQDVNLPPPIATGLKTMFFMDTDVTHGNVYFYKVCVWRGTQSFFSNQIVAQAGDIYWNKVKVLMRFDGDFTDLTGRVWNNDRVSFSDSIKKFGSHSLHRNLSGSSLSTPRTDDFNWWQHSGYTIEAYIQAPTATYSPSSAGRSDMVCCTDDGMSLYEWGFGVNENNKLSFAYWGGAERLIEGNTLLNDNALHHVAMTFDGLTIRLFVDGNPDAQANTVGVFQDYGTPLRIGSGSAFSNHIFYMDELRITPGQCRYVSAFTPLPAPFPATQ